MTIELLTAKQLAYKLDMRVNIIYNWVVLYPVPYHRIKGKLRFNLKEIEGWLQAREDRKRKQKEKSAKYYGVRDKIKILLADIVIAKIDIEELNKIYDFIAGLEKVQNIKGANDNE